MAKEATPARDTHAMTASSSRPVQMHARHDLEVRRQNYQGRDYWVIKDPLSLKFYRFEEEEYALFRMLDGHTSPDQIKLQFDYQYAPQKIHLSELYQFIGMLHRNSLIVSEHPNQGVELKKRGEKNRKRLFRQSLKNVMAIRFKGIDPDDFLTVLNQWVGWVFSWPVFFLVAMLMMVAGALIFTNFETFQSRLPTFQDFFAASNWIWLAAVLATTKVIHELGHGLACKRFGSQCHEMGFMLLVFTPCLYVNVSDSWMLPSKWKRIFIAAAGMYVELILASIAVFVWWFSNPGMIHQLALNVIFVCSVSTLIINANPLLRYDGYYILSDVLEIPNLRSKATSILQRQCGEWFLGIEPRHDPFLPGRHQWLFALYSVAAVAYRWLITLSIFWFVYQVLEPHGFKIIGQLIAMTVLGGLVIAPLLSLYKYFSVPGRLSTVKPLRFACSAAFLAGLLGAFAMFPIPHYVHCSFYVQPQNAVNVYVEVEGTLKNIFADPNTRVAAGQPILEVSSYQLQVQLASLKSALDLAKVEESNIVDAASVNPKAVAQIPHFRTAKKAAEDHLKERQLDLRRLTVLAPCDGLLIAPPRVQKESSDDGELRGWNDTPLNRKNLGALLERQTLVGQIVPHPEKMEAVLAIDQADIEFIHPDQAVDLFIHQLPAERYSSRMSSISPSKMKAVPKALSSRHGGDIVVAVDKDGTEIPESTTYLVKVQFENPDTVVLSGSTGTAKIHAGSKTIGQRFWRLLRKTFQFDL